MNDITESIEYSISESEKYLEDIKKLYTKIAHKCKDDGQEPRAWMAITGNLIIYQIDKLTEIIGVEHVAHLLNLWASSKNETKLS